MDQLASAADRIKKRRFLKRWSLMYELHALKKFYHLERGPRDWNFETFVDFMIDFAEFRQRYRDNKARSQGRIQKAYRVLMLASMHFQDAYNYQLDRLRRCVIHYAAVDGNLYPFCSYNCGPYHRERVERECTVSTVHQTN